MVTQQKEKKQRPSADVTKNIEAEKNVLGAILLAPEIIDEITLMVRPEDFYSMANRIIYQHMVDMATDNQAIDLTLFVDRLNKAGDMNNIGGMAYLGELMESTPNIANTKFYAKIVKECAVKRQVVKTAMNIENLATEDGKNTASDLLSTAEEQFFAIRDSKTDVHTQNVGDVLVGIFKAIDEKGNEPPGIETGFMELDSMLGGLRPSELTILAARPSMGKTALATNIAEHVAFNLKLPVLFISLEMTAQELASRIISSQSAVSASRIKNRITSEFETKKMVEKAGTLGGTQLFINDTPTLNMGEIAAIARRTKRQHGLSLLVIDYIGLINPDNSIQNRQEQVAKIARRLKGLARELEVPVLCLSQLNRQPESAKDNRPRLSHLRESGAIEQDADVVMFVHRDDYYQSKKETDKNENLDEVGVAEIIVAKHRNGPVGEVKLRWQPEFTKFSDYTVNDISVTDQKIYGYGSKENEYRSKFTEDFADYSSDEFDN